MSHGRPAHRFNLNLNSPQDHQSIMNMHELVDDQSTAEDAFRWIDRGCEAERAGRYREAIANFYTASTCLMSAAQCEIDDKVNHLLNEKSKEVLLWAQSLEASKDSRVPQRRHSRGIHVQVRGSQSPLWYTPVISKDPVSFTSDGYQLQCCKSSYYRPRMMIVITMYNEGPQELSNTLRKCCNNVAKLQKNKLPGYEGEEAWQNILICIVSDGRTTARPDTLVFLQDLGLFDEDAMTIFTAGLTTQVHLFEKTIVLDMASSQSHRGTQLFFETKSVCPSPPMQLLFALKEHNKGKLDSHHWFFNGFAAQVKPDYTVLIDVGTLPTSSAFTKLLAAMEVNQQVGGICGEIAVDEPLLNLCNFTVAAQHFEYKISNILDKATESCYGFISVLPGAFSAYRYKAIVGAPLEAYFKSLTTPMSELGPFYGNMYLAEDRILCFEILARKNCSWTMMYVKDAVARTDVPTNLVDLLAQRRRWNNGSLFAQFYLIAHWGRIYHDTRHSILRKIVLLFQYFMMTFQTVLNWFLPANFYLTCYFVIFDTLANWPESGDAWVNFGPVYAQYQVYLKLAFNGLYAFVLLVQIIMGLGNRPKHVKLVYQLTPIFYKALLSCANIMAALALWNQREALYQGKINLVWAIFGLAAVGVYFIAGALHCELHHLLLTCVQYFSYLPVMINVLPVYSFCNLQDLSWGTKGMDEEQDTYAYVPPLGEPNEPHHVVPREEYKQLILKRKALELKKETQRGIASQTKRRFDLFRSNLLLLWLTTNAVFVGSCVFLLSAQMYLTVLFGTIAMINFHRCLGAICFIIYTFRQWLVLKCCLCCGILDKRYQRTQKHRHQHEHHHRFRDPL